MVFLRPVLVWRYLHRQVIWGEWYSCANKIEGFPAESIGHAGRLLTDRFCRVKGLKDVYAIGGYLFDRGR